MKAINKDGDSCNSADCMQEHTQCDIVKAVGNVRQVGPGRQYSTIQAAYEAAAEGDTIEIYADGNYFGENANLEISKPGLTFVGKPANGIPRPNMVADLNYASIIIDNKAIWLIHTDNTTIDNIGFYNASADASRFVETNGAGIKLEPVTGVWSLTGYLRIYNSVFTNCQCGILVAGKAGTVDIQHSEFSYNGSYISDQEHNCYIGSVSTLIFRYNYSHHSMGGQLVKTRAYTNYIEYNRIVDEGITPAFQSSLCIDICDGGIGYLIGNSIEQGPYSANNGIIGFGMEFLTEGRTGGDFYVINNTIVNDNAEGVFFKSWVHNNTKKINVTFKNNILAGPGSLTLGYGIFHGDETDNFITASSDPGFFADKANFDYRLTSAAAACIGAGKDPGYGDGYPLAPVKQYIHKCGSGDRSVKAAPDYGAFEYRPGASDSIVPAAVTDLSAEANTDGSVKLSWTVPGKDKMPGKVVSYQVRYSTSVITETGWFSAIPALDAHTRAVDAGDTQYYTVKLNLKNQQKYFFAVKSADDELNMSALSNIAVATTRGSNLAANRPVLYSNVLRQAPGDLAFDDNLKSGWFMRTDSAGWVQVDLEAIRSVTSIETDWLASNMVKYRIDYSVDCINWKLLVDRSSNTTAGKVTDTFAPTDARHIKLTYTPGSIPKWVWLYEMKVF